MQYDAKKGCYDFLKKLTEYLDWGGAHTYRASSGKQLSDGHRLLFKNRIYLSCNCFFALVPVGLSFVHGRYFQKVRI